MGDALVFLRESGRQGLPVLAARVGLGPLRLPTGAPARPARVNKRYENGFYAVQDLDLDIADGDIAMVFQSHALYPHMSVADNIAYGLRNRRIDKAGIDRRAKKAADTEIQGARFVAAFAPRSRVGAGDQVEVVVDTERMHFFDLETGGAIRDYPGGHVTPERPVVRGV